MDHPTRQYVEALRTTHDRLAEFTSSLDAGELARPSYCEDWDLAGILSHLGSGAEIALEGLRAALGARTPMEQAEREALWERWNAKSTTERAADAVVTDDAFVSACEELDEGRLAGLSVPFHGHEIPAAAFLGFRLAEQALHSWDLYVVFEPSVRLRPEVVELLVDMMGRIVGFAAKPEHYHGPGQVGVRTFEPERELLLTAGDGAHLGTGRLGDDDPLVTLPAEGLVRLVYGRMDGEHTPTGIVLRGVELDDLRGLFPGF